MSQIANYSQIKIIYEDPDFLIIDKPSGLLTHPINRQDKSESVVGWLLEKYLPISVDNRNRGSSIFQPNHSDLGKIGTEIKNVGDDPLRPGIVHRLDRETSGLLLIAKNQPSFDYLKKLFAERKIKKTYLALVYGRLKSKSGVIETPLGKLGARQTTRTYGQHRLKEKSAITEYKVIANYSLPTTHYSLLEVSPQTGRTHQIRVHLKSIGYPVVCDVFYAGKKYICPAELGRLFLHAQRLSFVSPTGGALTVETDLPQELKSFLSHLKPFIKD